MAALAEQAIGPATIPGLGPTEIRNLCEQGVTACRLGQWRQGVNTLYAVIATVPTAKEIPSTAYSYLGYGRASLGEGYRDGVRLCHLGIKKDPLEAENYFNLARTCMLRRNRRMAVEALKKGLEMSPRHPELRQLRHDLGRRRRAVLPFLHRSSSLNQFLGKLRSRYLVRSRAGR